MNTKPWLIGVAFVAALASCGSDDAALGSATTDTTRGATTTAITATTSIMTTTTIVTTTSTTLVASADPKLLWGRTFVSRSMTGNDKDLALFATTKVTVTFELRADGGVMRWTADCNTMGARVTFDGERLNFTERSGTTAACDASRTAQDSWLSRFITSGLKWSLTGDTLVLSQPNAEIVFAPA